MNVAIFLPNWVGDAVMATPTLRAVRRYFGPAARIMGILRPQLVDLMAGQRLGSTNCTPSIPDRGTGNMAGWR